MPEKFLFFDMVKFGEKGGYDLKYHLAGDTRSYVYKASGLDSCSYFSEGLSMLEERSSNDVWRLLNNENRLRLPQSCLNCELGHQQTFWRTFTSTALTHFTQNNGRGRWIDENKIRYSEFFEKEVIPQGEVEIPGFTWITPNPELALAVGISRGLTSDEQITLMGVNLCQCCLANGTRMINVAYGVNNNRDYALKRVNKENIRDRNSFSHGIIVNQIPKEKLEQSVSFTVNMNPFLDLKAALVNSKISVGTNTSDPLSRELASIVDDIITKIAVKDPEVVRFAALDGLPRTWKIFLHPN